MAELTKRRKWIGLAVVALIVGGIGSICLLQFSHGEVPSPEEARVALAEAGWCQLDAPIIECDGEILIGNQWCDLKRKRFRGGFFYLGQGKPFRTPFGDWTPFWHWKVNLPGGGAYQ